MKRGGLLMMVAAVHDGVAVGLRRIDDDGAT
jgi:hypothetical protein